MRTTLDLRGMVKSPHDLVEILWEVDGSSGCTTCEAWRGQHEIDQLVKAGYTIMSVSVRRVNALLHPLLNTEQPVGMAPLPEGVIVYADKNYLKETDDE